MESVGRKGGGVLRTKAKLLIIGLGLGCGVLTGCESTLPKDMDKLEQTTINLQDSLNGALKREAELEDRVLKLESLIRSISEDEYTIERAKEREITRWQRWESMTEYQRLDTKKRYRWLLVERTFFEENQMSGEDKEKIDKRWLHRYSYHGGRREVRRRPDEEFDLIRAEILDIEDLIPSSELEEIADSLKTLKEKEEADAKAVKDLIEAVSE